MARGASLNADADQPLLRGSPDGYRAGIGLAKPPNHHPMPVCSYLVVPGEDRRVVAGRLSALDGCHAIAAENRDVIMLVTESDDDAAEAELRARLEEVPGIQSMVLTFGEIDPDTEVPDPMAAWKNQRRRHAAPEPPAAAPASPTEPETIS